jgi:hypothetical protein
MNNVEVSFLGKETRPAIILTDVKNIQFNNVKAQKGGKSPVLVLKEVTNFETNGGNMLKSMKLSLVTDKSF